MEESQFVVLMIYVVSAILLAVSLIGFLISRSIQAKAVLEQRTVEQLLYHNGMILSMLRAPSNIPSATAQMTQKSVKDSEIASAEPVEVPVPEQDMSIAEVEQIPWHGQSIGS